MLKERGYVVITEDINKAKDFNSYATAKKIAEKINGEVREIIPTYYENPNPM